MAAKHADLGRWATSKRPGLGVGPFVYYGLRDGEIRYLAEQA